MGITKEDLKKYKSIASSVENIREQIERLDYFLAHPSAGAPKLSNMPVYHNPDPDKVGLMMIRADDLRKLYAQKAEELLSLQIRIEDAITILSPLDESIIRLHYFRGDTWPEVAEAVHLSVRQTNNHHADCLKKLAAL